MKRFICLAMVSYYETQCGHTDCRRKWVYELLNAYLAMRQRKKTIAGL